MPVHHFLVSNTVPSELGSALPASTEDCRREGYRSMFDASSQSIGDVGAATKSLPGCQLGFFGVLHTCGCDPLVYHSHLRYVVPGSGVKTPSSQLTKRVIDRTYTAANAIREDRNAEVRSGSRHDGRGR